MRRRDFIRGIAGSLTWPLEARAQQGDRVRRVGFLIPFAKGDAENEARVQALKQKLADLGWVQGRNIQFDERWTTDSMEAVRSQAASLMASNPDVVVAMSRKASTAWRTAATTLALWTARRLKSESSPPLRDRMMTPE